MAAANSSAHADEVCTTLKQKTQQFSDAGQNGDGRIMSAMLDDNVVFFNEGGDQSTKVDMATGGPPPPAGVKTLMTVQDWNCKRFGNDVAVASFVDDQVQDFHGQIVHSRFRSVETWFSAGGDWRMVGSQTLALFDDPKEAILSSTTLDDYIGTYRASADVAVVLSREGDVLVASLNGGAKSRQAAEIRDVFFTPGRPRYRKLFQRDANGRVTGFLYRHEGHDIVFTKV